MSTQVCLRATHHWHPLPQTLDLSCRPGHTQGTSRGGADIREIVRRIDLWGLDMVFVIGGNGGNAAAHAIEEEIARQVNTTPWRRLPRVGKLV